jgi:LuxR family maltose regulon positive regulatory protein
VAEPASVARVSLRREHADRRTFWVDVLDEIARAHPSLTGLPVPARTKSSLAGVADALIDLKEPLCLVLDDFHEVASGEIPGDLEWLVGNVPGRLRLVLATRSDPPMRLQRLRVAGRLAEIRAAELAFTPAEALELLAPLELEEARVATLWERSEGWAAGLRLAELSLHDHPDPDGFIAGFAGDDRAVSDYLMSEVVSGYEHDTLLFMLRTSIVDRLNSEIADALAGTGDSAHFLRELERAEGFVEALDSSGTWFRYHPLFAEVLRAELRHRLPDELPALHRAASEWYARHDRPLEAVRHAVAAPDWRLAAEVIGSQWLVSIVHGWGPALRELSEQIPAEVVDRDAELALAMAGLLLDAGEIADADEYLVRAHERAPSLPAERRRRFTVTSTATALYRARLDGDVEEALSAARLALRERWDRAVVVEVRALTLANLGIAEFWANELDDALVNLQAAAGVALEFQNDFVLVVAECYLAAIDVRQGRLDDALSRARTAIQLAARRGWTAVPHLAMAYVALAAVHLWRHELADAEAAGDLAREALGRSPEPLLAPVVAQARARVYELRGDPVRALEILRGGHAGATLPPWLRVSGGIIEAELWHGLGEPARARTALAEISAISAPDAAVAVARLEVALGEPEAALTALEGLLTDEGETIIPVTRTEAWAIAAIARDATHDEAGALEAIERALDLAEPRGYWDALLRHGAAIRSLVRRRVAAGTGHRAFAGDLLAVLEQEPVPNSPNGNALLEPLSERELTVLRFLPTMMSNAEIASEMFVSVNTVKTHLKHIYRKLDVSERRDAVRRGRELHLLSPGLGDS